jgi:ABC-2 type transport system permease protein
MGKYLAIAKNSARSNFTYRANTVTMLISELFSFGVLFYIWFSIYQDGGQIGTYSLSFLIFYYVIGTIAGFMIEIHGVGFSFAQAISEGEFNNYILKPVSVIKQEMAKYLGVSFFNFSVLSLPAIALAIYCLKVFGLKKLLAFLLLSVNAGIIFFFVFFLIGSFAFFFQRIQGFSFAVSFLSYFFAGKLIPLDLLPEYMSRLAGWLPFQYISFIPIMAFRYDFSFSWLLQNYLAGLVWIVFLYAAVKLALSKGIKKYEAIGI